ncbi:unnamed protein product [Protopolystoma xenopodis]|uniref:Uncharacterized protein n=1 Tax=Protopolystoma xenopodis TaxID=117903 RepID=A0A3S5ACA7_9PLAT|nr:unnamed protein product [Protopolystoma xenopodis]
MVADGLFDKLTRSPTRGAQHKLAIVSSDCCLDRHFRLPRLPWRRALDCCPTEPCADYPAPRWTACFRCCAKTRAGSVNLPAIAMTVFLSSPPSPSQLGPKTTTPPISKIRIRNSDYLTDKGLRVSVRVWVAGCVGHLGRARLLLTCRVWEETGDRVELSKKRAKLNAFYACILDSRPVILYAQSLPHVDPPVPVDSSPASVPLQTRPTSPPMCQGPRASNERKDQCIFQSPADDFRFRSATMRHSFLYVLFPAPKFLFLLCSLRPSSPSHGHTYSTSSSSSSSSMSAPQYTTFARDLSIFAWTMHQGPTALSFYSSLARPSMTPSPSPYALPHSLSISLSPRPLPLKLPLLTDNSTLPSEANLLPTLQPRKYTCLTSHPILYPFLIYSLFLPTLFAALLNPDVFGFLFLSVTDDLPLSGNVKLVVVSTPTPQRMQYYRHHVMHIPRKAIRCTHGSPAEADNPITSCFLSAQPHSLNPVLEGRKSPTR